MLFGERLCFPNSILFILAISPSLCWADTLDSLELWLREKPQIQEKVYVHTDNNCYFIGDTIWYKAYVLRADDHHSTDMSKLLYVELLSPDGLVIERQRVVISDKGVTCAQFALKDSLYSGYYEIRAYTRWMLNFNVTNRQYTIDDRHRFYNNQMAKDYYRDWDGLYSRIIPVYSKPMKAGDYDGKYIYERPKMEMPWTPKKEIKCLFYPEGGLLLKGMKSRVAFEVLDQDGKAVDISGKLNDSLVVKTTYMGRGVFDVTPPMSGSTGKVNFQWNGKNYSFQLPEALSMGAVVTYQAAKNSTISHNDSLEFIVKARDCQVEAYAVLCRGRLYDFKRLQGETNFHIDAALLPSGVNELQIYDTQGNVLADRLFFVNHHDLVEPLFATTDKMDYQPFEPIQVSLKTTALAHSVPISVSLRDTRSDDTSYDDGNIMTDILLSSDLKGFIASPSYYFEKDDFLHKQALDLLMMVQGWRKYSQFATTSKTIGLGKPKQISLRYQPEQSITIEGTVNKQLGVDLLTINDVQGLNKIKSVAEEGLERAEQAVTVGNDEQYKVSTDNSNTDQDESELGIQENASEDVPFDGVVDTHLGVNHGTLSQEVLVEAELSKDGQVAGLVQKTNNGGKFTFQLPPFFDKAVLFMTAYQEKDSLTRSLSSRKDKNRLDEESYPDFYIKRDLFFPVFSHPYNYYQTHLPDVLLPSDIIDGEGDSKGLTGEHTLGTVKVEAKRRSRRAVDYTKPAYVVDAYDLYNEATDRGLSWGVVNMGTFPPIACQAVYGNMNRKRDYNVQAKLDKYTFFQNFSSTIESLKNRATTSVFRDLHLKRIKNFRFYTDYEPRNYTDPHTEQLNMEDVTLVYELIPDNGTRYTYRDRRYVIQGITYPEKQYCPDYSKMKPSTPTDYRRTLYWNPNAILDANGEFHVTVYNNSRETRVTVDAVGLLPNGKFLVQQKK